MKKYICFQSDGTGKFVFIHTGPRKVIREFLEVSLDELNEECRVGEGDDAVKICVDIDQLVKDLSSRAGRARLALSQ